VNDVAGSGTTARPRGGRLPRQERRTQLLDSALGVFVAQGYHAAAMDDIAERAGVSKPVLYQHFPGKRELYLALLEQQVDELADRVGQAMAGTDDNRTRVDGAVGAYFDFIDAEGEAFRLVFESDLRNDDEVRAVVDRGTRVCVEAIAEVIAADTGADPERALLLASGLTGLAETSARWWLPRKGTVSREEAVSLMSALAWRGISGFPLVDGEHPTS
jgi:AcrR family transcriptional regulator